MWRSRTVRGLLLLVTLMLAAFSTWRALSGAPGAGPAAGISPDRLDRESAVIGVVVNGQSRAYPLRLLGVEVVNDQLGDQPIVVTF